MISRTSGIGAPLLAATMAMCAVACSDNSESEAAIDSPLSEYLGYPIHDIDGAYWSQYSLEDIALEQELAACMADRGFEYTAFPKPNRFDVFAAESVTYATTEFAQTFGFGISTSLFAASAIGPDLVGHDLNYGPFAAPNPFLNPRPSEAEAHEINVALVGEDLGDGEGSCLAEAVDVVEPLSYAWNEQHSAFVERFALDLNQLRDTIENDPRVATKQFEVEACMADLGFDYKEVDTLTAFEERTGEVSRQYWTNDAPTMSSADAATLGRVQSDEIQLATAVAGCNDGVVFLSHNPELQDVRVETEQAFIDEHEAELQPFRLKGN